MDALGHERCEALGRHGRAAAHLGPSKAVKTTHGLHTLPLLGGSDLARLNRPMIESLIEELDFIRAPLSDEPAQHWTTDTAARSVTALSLAKPLLTIEGAWRDDASFWLAFPRRIGGIVWNARRPVDLGSIDA
jgi:hypothetical protein